MCVCVCVCVCVFVCIVERRENEPKHVVIILSEWRLEFQELIQLK